MLAYSSATGTTRPCSGSSRSGCIPRRSKFCTRFTWFALGTGGGGLLGGAGV